MKKISLLLLSPLLFVSNQSFAQTAQSNFDVSTQVSASCSIENLNDIAFGVVDAVNTNVFAREARNQFVVRCTQGAENVKVLLSAGENTTCGTNGLPGDFWAGINNSMKSSENNFIPYNISYLINDNTSLAVFPCALNASTVPTLSYATGYVNTIHVVASIASSDIAIGTYSDRLTVNVIF